MKTNTEYYDELIAVIDAIDGYERADEMLQFLERERAKYIKSLEAKKDSQAKRRAEYDKLTAEVASLLTNDWQTIDEIMSAIKENTENLSERKVQYRIGALIKKGIAAKHTIKKYGKSFTYYRLSQL